MNARARSWIQSHWIYCFKNSVYKLLRSVLSNYPPLRLPSPVSILGGELRGSLGKLPEFPVTFLLGMRLLADGDDVYSGLRGRLCKNHLGAPVYGLLHPGWFGKIRLFFPPLPPLSSPKSCLSPSIDCVELYINEFKYINLMCRL